MKLPERILEPLAQMVIGDNPLFPYRSSYFITRFFNRCGLDYKHDGSTRCIWTRGVLAELNLGPSNSPDLPSIGILQVIDEMLDPYEFGKHDKSTKEALDDLNKLIAREGLEAYFDSSDHCRIRNKNTGRNSSLLQAPPPPLSPEEIGQRRKVATFLDSANEDDFTEKLLVPLFRRLGFYRVSPTGHKEKTLEFGKDLWMKYQLPTGHWLYFCAQIKREKIDASGAGGGKNVANVLAQARMAFEHPIFDPDTNRKVPLDHMFIISAGEITRAARDWLGERLDTGQRRQIIFMDRDEFLNHSGRTLVDLVIETESGF
jgi:hypothetical protein